MYQKFIQMLSVSVIVSVPTVCWLDYRVAQRIASTEKQMHKRFDNLDLNLKEAKADLNFVNKQLADLNSKLLKVG